MGQNHTGYRFGEFMLDPRTGTVTGPGGEVVLRRKNFLLLEALLAHAPALMSRDRLLDLVWGHDALSPNVLPQAMSELRQALGDDPQAPRYIETRHRRGYRMVCPVEQVDTDADGQRGGLAGGDPPAGTLVDSKGDGGGGPVPPGRTTATEAGAPGDARARWWSRRRQLIAAGLAIVIAGGSVALVGHQWQRQSDWRQLHHGILPQARALVETDLFGAYRLLREARSRVSGDPVLEQAWRDITLPVAIESQPQGALVWIGRYGASEPQWQPLGRTPLADVRVPLTQMRLRAELDGHDPVELAPSVLPSAEPIHLHRTGQTPAGMVYVPAGTVEFLGTRADVDAFWLDRREVTNAEFLRFVRAGGYRDRRWWSTDLAGAERWERHVGRFVDRTGMAGPSTWSLGTFPEGRDDHPVEGVGWYEADAYARWSGKSLPSAFQWWRAAGLGTAQAPNFSAILGESRFDPAGTAAAGPPRGLGPYGTVDMAGNVAEWCGTSSGRLKFILGGAYQDNQYQFRDADARDPLDRRAGNGIRLALAAAPGSRHLPDSVARPAPPAHQPVGEELFKHYLRRFAYDRVPPDARILERDEGHDAWRRERISIAQAEGTGRLEIQLFLPRDAVPPYQAVVHFPGGDALMLDDSRQAGLLHVEPFLRSGRAVAYPVYTGTFERRGQEPAGPLALRETITRQVREVRRTVDYLVQRPDIDPTRIAYHGVSLGGWMAPYALAAEDRFRTAMLLSAGLTRRTLAEEVDQRHYLPRVHLPLLMVNGRDDFAFPLEASQKPFFEALGTANPRKRHVVLDWGHLPPGYLEVQREILAWSDRWLGPVRSRPQGAGAGPVPASSATE
jgi:DNA-binding winged helix-turn-helix (wHTH) protein